MAKEDLTPLEEQAITDLENFISTGKAVIVEISKMPSEVVDINQCVEDAEKRDTYLSAFDGSVLASRFHKVVGTLVVRTYHTLTASQQAEREARPIEPFLV